MCDNYLLLFLGLRTLDNNSHRDVNIPWKKTTQFIRSFFYRNRISNGNNYLDENDILKCVNSHKNKQVLKNVGNINFIDSHLDDSPVNIYTSNSPSSSTFSPNLGSINSNRDLKTTINRNYINNSKQLNQKNKSLLLCLVSWLYSIGIFCILCIPVFCYVKDYIDNNSYYIPYVLFYTIYPIQYIFSIMYYSKDHYDRLIHKWNTDYISNNYFSLSKKDTATIFIFVISILISIVTLVLSINNNFDIKYSNYFNKNNQYVLLCFEWLYGRTLVLYNLFVFFFTFHTHLSDIKKDVDFLEKSNWVFYKDTKRISDICISIIIKKFELEESISNLQDIFSSSTILGTIGFLITWINYKQYGSDTYLAILCGIYSIIQLYFSIIILQISKQQQSMINSIRHPIFAAHWLQRINNKYKQNIKNDEKQYITINENGTSIDWLILNTILQEKWVNFEFFGIPLNDGQLVKRCFGLAIMILGINKVSIDYFMDPNNVINN